MVDSESIKSSTDAMQDGGISKVISTSDDKEITPCTLEKGLQSDAQECAVDSDAQSLSNQTNLLTTRQLMIALPALSLSLFVSFIDQTSISTSIPALSADLNAGSSTSWVGGSFLIASTAFQLINGRLSDIFGRKICLLVCLGLLATGDLLCGFATSANMLFVFRAIAGIGAGGVNSVAMIIVSDITTLESRGKYQGILGAVIALANGTGPFLGGVLVEKASWRWVFWIIPPLTVPAILIIWAFLPLKHDSGEYMKKIGRIDFIGVILNIGAVLMILIPVSGGGLTYAWNSAFVIAMIICGGLLAVVFLLYEWKFAKIPIMPLHITLYPSCGLLYFQNFFTGLVFFGNFFYLPIYFQSIRGYTAIESGALLLPLIIATSCSSLIAGQIMSRTGYYKLVIVAGFMIWSIGGGLKCLYHRHTPLRTLIASGIVEGIGVGFTLQPTLVAILANSRQTDRAVATGLRNFVRTIGGSTGLAVSGAILNNTLRTKLSGLSFITPALLDTLSSSTYGLSSLGLTAEEKNSVLDAYMAGLEHIYLLYVCSTGLNLLISIFIRDTSLIKKAAVDVQDEEDAAAAAGAETQNKI
ncbi:MFS general substrate transporter-61 [Coleophoma crateriformis]|uniref:MFS general substrate transporter-61 n=1 Tax=Coleophoma crateriformis TaxID=565419 RepID=A0A3D8RJK8_9HELO|nr:MFS general substrate transporter-61 [Coleophoma crateriformis]